MAEDAGPSVMKIAEGIFPFGGGLHYRRLLHHLHSEIQGFSRTQKHILREIKSNNSVGFLTVFI